MLNSDGGGDSNYVKITVDMLDSVPEMPQAYPEFSQFKELPAWGFFFRHVDGLEMKNIMLITKQKDYRLPVVADDVRNLNASNIKALDAYYEYPVNNIIYQR